MSKLRISKKNQVIIAALQHRPNELKKFMDKLKEKQRNSTFKKQSFKTATILYEKVNNETYEVEVHKKIEKKPYTGKDDWETYESCDDEGYSYNSHGTIKLNNFQELIEYNVPTNKLNYYKNSDLVFIDGDKLTYGKYIINKVKRCGKNHFKDTRNNSSFSVNLKTGCFYEVQTSWKANKIDSKTIRKNNFNLFNNLFKNSDAILIFINYLANASGIEPKDNLNDMIVEWFVKFHSIKVNDNYKTTLTQYYPGLRVLRKSKLNLVESLMKHYKLTGNKIRKIINTNENVNIFNIKFFSTLFDISIFNNLDEEFIDKYFLDSEMHNKNLFLRKLDYSGNSQITYNDFLKTELPSALSLGEQRRLLKVLIDGNYNTEPIDIIDHLRMKTKIEKAGKIILKIQARTHEEFTVEHELYTKLCKMIDDKYVITITYPEEMIKAIDNPIKIGDNIYNVVLLKSAEQYIYEGSYQEHCVGGYVTHATHIVSVRLDKIWMTSEYDTAGQCRQNKMKLNKLPTEEWVEVKKELDSRMKKLGYDSKIAEKKIERVLIESTEKIQEQIVERMENEILLDDYEEVDFIF